VSYQYGCDKTNERVNLASNKTADGENRLNQRNLEKGMKIKRLFLHLLPLHKACKTLTPRNMLNLLREKSGSRRSFGKKNVAILRGPFEVYFFSEKRFLSTISI
jgi:hypothetical protein